MVRSALQKVVWVGRASVFLVGLAVMLAVVFGVGSTAFAHGGYKGLLHLGHSKTAKATTTLVGDILDATNSALVVQNTGGGSALELQVNGGAAPLKVNADAGKATNLDADKLDGQEASSFASASHEHEGGDITSGTVAEGRIDGSIARDTEIMERVTQQDGTGSGLDADLLDGKDASAFGLKLRKSGMQFSDSPGCNSVNTWNECAKIQVTVPAGKTYEALIIAEGTFYESGNDSETKVLFCPSARLTTAGGADCVAEQRGLLLKSGDMQSTSDASWRTLTEGTWILSSAIFPTGTLNRRLDFDVATVQTVALIRDASAPAPQTE